MPYPDAFYWYYLHCQPGIGSGALADIVRVFGCPRKALSEDISLWGDEPIAPRILSALMMCQKAPPDSVLRQWENFQCMGIHVICPTDDTYPELLAAINDPPGLLYVRGQLSALAQPQLAIVGSRNASHAGLDTARAFAGELANHGLVVTSGLALGIDTAAHQGALEGGGQTIAVLGTGVDSVYPRRNAKLADAIVENGALVSEFAPGTEPKAGHFPRRNRIIAGLSYGTLVVEAAPRSGSLITARLALDYNREVFAVPGSIHNPRVRGCHQLIRDGAALVETVPDILTELAIPLKTYLATRSRSKEALVSTGGEKILAAVGFEPTTIDVIARRCGVKFEQLTSDLLELELAGHIFSVAGGYQREA